MNKLGKQQLNNEAVRQLMNKKQQLDNSTYVITDDLKNIILVDIHDGVTYKYDYYTNEMIECNTGDKSSKQNGYVYTELNLCIDGQMQKVNYGTHSLIAMCAYTEQYDCLVDNDVTPVVNHMDNCPFNNTPSNLEWTTHALNVLHGRLIRCAKDAHNSEHSLAWLGYDLYKQQSNNKYNFDCLKVKISCQDLSAYEQYIIANNKRVKSLKQYWGLTDKEALISLYEYDPFIKWWAKRNNINLKQYKPTQTA